MLVFVLHRNRLKKSMMICNNNPQRWVLAMIRIANLMVFPHIEGSICFMSLHFEMLLSITGSISVIWNIFLRMTFSGNEHGLRDTLLSLFQQVFLYHPLETAQFYSKSCSLHREIHDKESNEENSLAEMWDVRTYLSHS